MFLRAFWLLRYIESCRRMLIFLSSSVGSVQIIFEDVSALYFSSTCNDADFRASPHCWELPLPGYLLPGTWSSGINFQPSSNIIKTPLKLSEGV